MKTAVPSDTLFEVKNIRKSFRNEYSINYIGDMIIKRGHFTFLTGSSGVGKSTLLHILGLLDQANKNDEENGSVLTYYQTCDKPIDYFKDFKGLWQGPNMRASIRRTDFGFLPQDGHLLNTFSIQENLELVLQSCPHACPKSGNGVDKEVQKILEDVGFTNDENIWECLKSSPLNLSGGQRQRLALARAVICDYKPKVIFVDEPTTFMNDTLVESTVDLLYKQVNNGCSVILVTHEYKKLSQYLRWNFATFQVTDSTLTSLQAASSKDEGIAEDIKIENLIRTLEPLKDNAPLSKKDFWDAIQQKIVNLSQHRKELILRYSLQPFNDRQREEYQKFHDRYELKGERGDDDRISKVNLLQVKTSSTPVPCQ